MARTEVTGSQIKDQSVSLTLDVTGILPVANGGTGSNTLALNSVLLGNGNGALQAVAPGTAANVLRSNGTTWASAALTKSDVGLANVDNTSDATKNSATATLTNKTISGASNTLSAIPQSAVTNLQTALQTDQISTNTGTQLVLNGGDSVSAATGQTAEIVYINAEGGLQVNSSPDNWVGGWAVRKTATICDSSGNSSFPGSLSAQGNVALGNTTSTSTAAPLIVNLGGTFGNYGSGASGNLKLVMHDNGTIKYGIGISGNNSGQMEYQVPSSGHSHRFFVGGVERLAVTNTAVQIGGVDAVTTTGTQTLTNKTLTSPIINGPTGTDPLVIQNNGTASFTFNQYGEFVSLAGYGIFYDGNVSTTAFSATGALFLTSGKGGATNQDITLKPSGTGKISLSSATVEANGVPVVTTTATQTLTNKTITGTFTGGLTGNASTATTLQTARTINGVSFNGSANITVADSTKEPVITAGTTAQYWRGDKTFQTLNVAAVSGAEATANKGQAGGYASLDGGGKVPVAQLPNSIMEYQGTWNASTNTPTLANGTGSPGDVYRVSVAGTNLGLTVNVGDYVLYNGTVWEKSDTTDAVGSVNGYTGNITLTKADVGLGSADNTADAAKNVLSAATLTTARTINGVSFNGSANITIADSTKEPAITAGTTAQYWRGDKSWQTLNATAVGLGNVDNTSNATERAATATLTNKTISGASNTLTNIPASATPDASRLVCTTALGDIAASNGANTWAKIATFSSGTNQFAESQVILSVANANSGGHDTAIISVLYRANATNSNPTLDVRIISKGGTYGGLGPDSFKMVSGGWATSAELWIRKNAAYGVFAFYETVRNNSNGSTITYNNNAAWQSATPTGTVNNVSSDGVHVGMKLTVNGDIFANGTVPVVTTTATQTLTNKTLGAPIFTQSGGYPRLEGSNNGLGLSGLGHLGAATTAGAWANSASTGDVVLRAETNNLVLAARNASGGIRFSTGDTDSEKLMITNPGVLTSNYNTASGLSTFSTAQTVIGNIHIQNPNGGNTTTQNQAAITFAGGSTNAQAGIYVLNNNTDGTRMGFATTNNYATGPQLFMTASNTGVVNFPRALPQFNGVNLVDLSSTQTLTNKTLTSPTLTAPVLGTPASGNLANCSFPTLNQSTTGNAATATNLVASTSTAVALGTIELGHASDTTLSRSAAGVLAVEGVVVPTISSTSTLTNKTLTSPTLGGTVAGSFTFSGDIEATSGKYLRFGHASNTDGNDGRIGAGLFGSGLNIVGTQTSAGLGRQVRVWGALIDDSGNSYTTTSSTSTLTNKTLTSPVFSGIATGSWDSNGRVTFYNNDTTLTTADYLADPLSIRERGLVGNAQTADGYAPALNFHWGSTFSQVLWMGSNGWLNYGGDRYTGSAPGSNGIIRAGQFRGALVGNADTATTLATARTIGGVSFNGSANINLPGVNTAGNQNTTGNAATATTLATARNINGVGFNGSADITLPTVNTTGDQTIGGTKTFSAPIKPSCLASSWLAGLTTGSAITIPVVGDAGNSYFGWISQRTNGGGYTLGVLGESVYLNWFSNAQVTAGTNSPANVIRFDNNGDFYALGAGNATRFVSSVATGTAPLTVSSTTLVTNLNADLLDGLQANTGTVANTVVARNANGDTYARYVHSEFLHMDHAAGARTTDTVFYSSNDNYVRKNTAAGFKTALALNNVDNTSNATERAATATLTNKTLTAPVLSGTVTGTYTLGGTPTVPSTVVLTTDTQTLTNKRVTPRVNTITSSATPSINTDTTDHFTITALAAAITSVTVTGTPTDGQKLMVRIKDNGTARAIAWGASFVASGVAPLLTTTVANKTHLCSFVYDSAIADWVAVATDDVGY